MNKFVFLVVLSLIFPLLSFADEGMWLINLLNKVHIEKMQSKGLHLSAKDIYDINNASIKDAIVAIDRGSCTGEIVSSNGLMLTNHHCAYDDIHSLSSLEHDYLKDGYWAASKAEEIPIKGKTVSFLVKVKDVTEEVRKEIAKEQQAGNSSVFMMRKVMHTIERRYGKDTDLQLSCVEMYRGLEYYLYYYKTYRDIRLVGAPPASIGAFGGDTDNWMWPQHKGDFAVYRIYGDSDGEPADYSSANLPIKPKYVLPISLKGVKENDFTMVIGYPGSTKRYLSSYGVEFKLNQENIPIIKTRAAKLKIIKEAVNKDNSLRLKYASKYFNESNVYKFLLGENKYTKRYKVIEEKKEQERLLNARIAGDADFGRKYGNITNELNDKYSSLKKYAQTLEYFKEAVLGGPEIMLMAMRITAFKSCIERAEKEKRFSARKRCRRLNALSDEYYRNYYMETDKKIFSALLKIYTENAHTDGLSDYWKRLIRKYKGDYDSIADYVYSKSFLSSKERFTEFLDDPNITKIEKDPACRVCESILDKIYKIRETTNEQHRELGILKDKYAAAIVELKGGEEQYPDANSTMRYTYGTAGGYSPADAVRYHYNTEISGYTEKASDDSNSEFFIDNKLRRMISEKDFGRYADNGELYTCFITNNDITGGNSGSPVLNGDGELVGLAYDGNWESVAGDLYFHSSYNKTVCVDIRFIMWVIDKYAGASHIADEMNIVR